MTFDARRPSIRNGEAGLRAGMSTAEMLERFARLNALDPRDAMQHIADATSPSPYLRARLVADRLAAESGAPGRAFDAALADPFFDRWLAARGFIAHRGVTWARVRTLGHHPIVLTLASIARLRTRTELVRLDDDLRTRLRGARSRSAVGQCIERATGWSARFLASRAAVAAGGCARERGAAVALDRVGAVRGAAASARSARAVRARRRPGRRHAGYADRDLEPHRDVDAPRGGDDGRGRAARGGPALTDPAAPGTGCSRGLGMRRRGFRDRDASGHLSVLVSAHKQAKTAGVVMSSTVLPAVSDVPASAERLARERTSPSRSTWPSRRPGPRCTSTSTTCCPRPTSAWPWHPSNTTPRGECPSGPTRGRRSRGPPQRDAGAADPAGGAAATRRAGPRGD